MTLLLLRAGWFVSLMVLLATLLYVYAGLPEEVLVQQTGASYLTLSRELFFYAALGLATLVNALVFIIFKMFSSGEMFRSWFYGLIASLNVFIIVTLFLMNTINSAEIYDYTKIGFLIYGSVSLVLLWSVSWPVYSLFRKIFPKPSV